jgi:hypothetical protein
MIVPFVPPPLGGGARITPGLIVPPSGAAGVGIGAGKAGNTGFVPVSPIAWAEARRFSNSAARLLNPHTSDSTK